MDRRVLWWPIIAVLALLGVGSLAWASTKAIGASDDLMRRAEEVRLFLRGANPYDDPDMTYPPSALAVFVPLIGPLAQSATALRLAWLAVNLGALSLVAWLLVELWGKPWPRAMKLAFVLTIGATKPVRGGIGLGQFHLIPLAMMLLVLYETQRRRRSEAGCWMAIALVKPTMSLPLLAFWVVRRQWRVLIVAFGLHLVALAAVSAWTHTAPWRLMADWLANARTQEAAGTLDVPSLLDRACPHLLPASWISLGILLVAWLMVWRLRKHSDPTLVSLSLFFAAIFSYHRHYDLVLLLPALALACNETWRASGAARIPLAALTGGFALLLIAPSHPSATGSLEWLYDRLFPPAVYVLATCVFSYGMWEKEGQRREGAPSYVHADDNRSLPAIAR